jgi:hypothetical protein
VENVLKLRKYENAIAKVSRPMHENPFKSGPTVLAAEEEGRLSSLRHFFTGAEKREIAPSPSTNQTFLDS